MATQAVCRSKSIPLPEYLAAEFEEINSSLNEWGAGQEFGHPPDDFERSLHYIHCRRAEEFCAAHSDDNIWYASQALNCDVTKLNPTLREKVLIAFFDLWHEVIKNWEQQHDSAPFPLKDFFRA